MVRITMDELPNELLFEILARCSEYAPALKRTCRLWRNATRALQTTSRARTVLSLVRLAELGHVELIEDDVGREVASRPASSIACSSPRPKEAA